jgi:hypothetical protein
MFSPGDKMIVINKMCQKSNLTKFSPGDRMNKVNVSNLTCEV